MMYYGNLKPKIIRVIAFASMLLLFFLSFKQNDVSIIVLDTPPQ